MKMYVDVESLYFAKYENIWPMSNMSNLKPSAFDLSS